jgi:hypothetical protein
MSAFCDPATTTSTPHSSWGSGTAPSPDTASTAISAPCRCATSVSSRMSLTTPVEVSEKVVNTSSMAGFEPSRSSSAAGSIFRPHSVSQWIVSAP